MVYTFTPKNVLAGPLRNQALRIRKRSMSKKRVEIQGPDSRLERDDVPECILPSPEKERENTGRLVKSRREGLST